MAKNLAKSFGAELRLFHVVEPEPSYTAYGFSPDEFPALHAYQLQAKQRAAEKLKELCVEVQKEVPNTIAQVAEGGPLHTIVEYVKDSHADMVVLGAHGHGAIASLLLGSVAEGMVRKAVVPTLIVPAAKKG
jgi:nucleotide-binding universal stress UspA family protein